jgi:hypothetical protein
VTVLALTVLPESTLQSHWFSVLASFVAINTILYVTLSIFKIMPKAYLNDFIKHHGRRAETRSIYPDGHNIADEALPERAMQVGSAGRR